jgi:hypothetical protein
MTITGPPCPSWRKRKGQGFEDDVLDDVLPNFVQCMKFLTILTRGGLISWKCPE